MSTLTIINAEKAQGLVKTEIDRYENGNIDPDICSVSYEEFTLTGDVVDFPVTLNLQSSPSGGSASIHILNGSATIKESDGTPLSFPVYEQQIPDGTMNLFTNRPLLLTQTGTVTYRVEINVTDGVRAAGKMVDVQCTASYPVMNYVTTVSASGGFSADDSSFGTSMVNMTEVSGSTGSTIDN